MYRSEGRIVTLTLSCVVKGGVARGNQKWRFDDHESTLTPLERLLFYFSLGKV